MVAVRVCPWRLCHFGRNSTLLFDCYLVLHTFFAKRHNEGFIIFPIVRNGVCCLKRLFYDDIERFNTHIQVSKTRSALDVKNHTCYISVHIMARFGFRGYGR